MRWLRLNKKIKHTPKRLTDSDIRLTAFLMAGASAPIALTMATLSHLLIFPIWLALWGLALMPRSTLRNIVAMTSIIGIFIAVRFLAPPPDERFFMLLVMLFGVIEQLDRSGRPSPFAVLGVVFPALCAIALSSSLMLFVLMLVSVGLYLGIFVLRYNNMPLSGLRIRILRVVGILGGAFLATLMIFILLPRIDLSDIPKLVSERALTGVSDRLEIGRFSEVIQNGETAFRAFLPEGINVKEFYWRVYVLTEAKNGKWERGLSAAPAFQKLKESVGKSDPDLTYTIRHANPAEPWLPVLGTPSNLPPPNLTQISLSGEITIPAKTDRMPRLWNLSSVANGNINASLPEFTSLQGHPRLKAWAKKQRLETDSDSAFAEKLLIHFQSQGFSYSLSPPALRGDKMDNFFFETKQGYCGHYAMAFATAMRAAGIPANVVVGYSGGAWNEFGNYALVRQSDAHAWVEAKIDGTNWQRYDPTKVVPLLNASTNISQETGATTPLLQRPGTTFTLPDRLSRIARWVDHQFVRLNNEILTFDAKSREDFLNKLSLGRVLSYLAIWGLTLSALLAPLLLFKLFTGRDPLTLLDSKFTALAGKIGFHRAPAEGRLDFSKRIAQERPDIAERVRAYTQLWSRCYFTNNVSSDDVAHLKEILIGIRQSVSN